MDNELDLHQNIEPMHLHFYPVNNQIPRKKKCQSNIASILCGRNTRVETQLPNKFDTYHIRIK